MKARIEVRQVEFMVGQVVERMLERSGEQLSREIDAQKPRMGIEWVSMTL